MAAPTPISALVHRSTLVTAGVFILFRFSYNTISLNLFFLRGLTILLAGVSALIEKDRKKIIALSTLRNLGVIMFRISIGYQVLAFFHLLAHAFFKALIFIHAGLFILIYNHTQDTRQKRGVWKVSFFYSIGIRVPILSLMGFPFLNANFSKDFIFEGAYNISILRGALIFSLLFLTILYSIRLIAGLYNSYSIFPSFIWSSSSSKNSIIPFFLLSPLSILLGVYLSSAFYIEPTIRIRRSYKGRSLILLIIVLLFPIQQKLISPSLLYLPTFRRQGSLFFAEIRKKTFLIRDFY